MQYRELQAALKNLRNAGYDVQVKLNTSQEILQAEYDRLTSQSVVEPVVEMTAEQFNGWVGLPTDTIAIAKDSQELALEPQPEPNLYFVKQPYERLEAPQDNSFPILDNPQPEPRGDTVNLRQNEGSTELQNSESLVQQKFSSIWAIQDNTRIYPTKPLQNNPEVLSHKELNIQPKARGYRGNMAKPIYWVDGSELGQQLDSTQVQALRNLQDGFRQLKQWASNLKAFAEGFIEAGQVKQPKRSPKVIALDRYRYPQVA